MARDLCLTANSVQQWVKQAEMDDGRGPVGAPITAEREKLAQLRREVRMLRQEREVLRNAAAFFAKETTR